MKKIKKMTVSNSTLQSYRKCGMLFLQENVMRLEPKEPKIALSFGSLIHAGLEAHYDGREIRLEDVAAPELRLVEHGERYSINHAWNLLERYKMFYKDIDKEYENIATEQEFTIQINEWLFYTGSIDQYVRKISNGGIRQRDHKTTSSFYNFIPMAKPNHQATGYIFLLQEVAGIAVEDFEFNGINSKVLDFKDPNKLFMRTTTTRNQLEIEEWKQGMIKEATKMKADIEADDYSFNDTACNLYGRCQFADVCSLSPENRADFIKNSFKVKDEAHAFRVEFEGE